MYRPARHKVYHPGGCNVYHPAQCMVCPLGGGTTLEDVRCARDHHARCTVYPLGSVGLPPGWKYKLETILVGVRCTPHWGLSDLPHSWTFCVLLGVWYGVPTGECDIYHLAGCMVYC